MIKQIETYQTIEVVNKTGTSVDITYQSSIPLTKIKKLKINKAILKFKIGIISNNIYIIHNPVVYESTPEIYSVYYTNSQTQERYIIDEFSSNMLNVCIDITDELQKNFAMSQNNITLTVENLQNFEIIRESTEIQLEYSYKKQILDRQEAQTINAGKAGNGQINLSTGVLDFSFEDFKSNAKVLPIAIKHSFSLLESGENKRKAVNTVIVFIPMLISLICSMIYYVFISKDTFLFDDIMQTSTNSYVISFSLYVIYERVLYVIKAVISGKTQIADDEIIETVTVTAEVVNEITKRIKSDSKKQVKIEKEIIGLENEVVRLQSTEAQDLSKLADANIKIQQLKNQINNAF